MEAQARSTVIYSNGTDAQYWPSASGTIELVAGMAYEVVVEILRNDLGNAWEYATDVRIGGTSLGWCKPDGSDYDCTFYTCSSPTGSQFASPFLYNSSTDVTTLEIDLTGHSHDCDCDTTTWECSQEYTVEGRTPMTATARFTFTPSQAVLTPSRPPTYSFTTPPTSALTYSPTTPPTSALTHSPTTSPTSSMAPTTTPEPTLAPRGAQNVSTVIYSSGTVPQDMPSASGTIELVAGTAYDVVVEILRNDLGDPNEYVLDVRIGETSLGWCRPDGDDLDCTFYTCSSGDDPAGSEFASPFSYTALTDVT